MGGGLNFTHLFSLSELIIHVRPPVLGKETPLYLLASEMLATPRKQSHVLEAPVLPAILLLLLLFFRP